MVERTAASRGPIDPDLLRIVPELRRHLLVAGVGALTLAAAVVAQAEMLARGLAALVGAAAAGPSVVQMCAGLAVVALVRAAVAWVVERSAGSTMCAARRRVREAVLDHTLALSAGEARGARETNIATAGVDQLEPYVRQYLPALTQAVALPLVAGARIALADWVSAAIVIVTVPLIPIFMVLIGKLTQRRSERSWAALQRLGGHFLDVLEGLPTLRLFGRADAQAVKVREISEAYRRTTMQTLRIAMLSALALELLATLSVAVIAVAIGLRLLSGGLTLATGLVVLLLAPECYLPLRRVGANYHAAQNGLDAAAELGDLLAQPVPRTGDLPVPDVRSSIEVRSVSARGGTVCVDTPIRVRAGELVALVGPSGVGKTTVLDAIRGRLVDQVGEVLVNGVDVAQLDPDDLADRIAVITQRPEPLASTVAEELTERWPLDPRQSSELVGEALAAVGLSDFAGRRSGELSGGQFRRVQVARALLSVRSGGASIVLADEPTAQLDADAADVIRTALAALASEGAAVVVATHDAELAAVADRVVDLADPTSTAPLRNRTAPVSRPVDDPAPDPAEPVAPVGESCRGVVPNEAGLPTVGALRSVLAAGVPARRRLAGAVGLGVLAEACSLGLAAAAAWLIVRASERPDLAAVSLVVVGVRGFGVGKGVFRYAERLATHDAGLRSLAELRARVVDRLAAVAPGGVPGWRRGDVATRVVDDVDRLLDAYVRVLVPTLSVALATGLAALVTLVIDPGAGLVLLVALGIVAVLTPAATLSSERRVAGRLTAARAAVRSEVLDVIEHADAVVAHRLAASRRERIAEAAAIVDSLERRRTRSRARATMALAAAAPCAVAATLAVLGGSPALAAPTIGVLVLWPLTIVEVDTAINESAAAVPGVVDAARRVGAVLNIADPVDETDAITADGEAQHLEDETTGARLRSFSAAWPSTGLGVGPVDLDLRSAQTVTIVGSSGSGKSTLAAALVRFCPATAGRFELRSDLDGGGASFVDVDRVSDAAVRRAVTWVEQAPWIADTTVRENLRIGSSDATDDDMLAALETVALGPWFAGLDDGLDTHVGRHGASMSGGEAHRLALARAVLAAHPVVVLDEPTSHLDAVTAAAVIAGVDEGLGGRSLVVLANQPLGFDGDVVELRGRRDLRSRRLRSCRSARSRTGGTAARASRGPASS